MGVTPHVCVTHFYIARTAVPIAFKLGRLVKANIPTISTSYEACNSTGLFTNDLWMKPAKICQCTCARAASVTHILIGEHMGHVISEMFTKFERNRSNCVWDMLLKPYRNKWPLIFRRIRSVQSRFMLSMVKLLEGWYLKFQIIQPLFTRVFFFVKNREVSSCFPTSVTANFMFAKYP